MVIYTIITGVGSDKLNLELTYQGLERFVTTLNLLLGQICFFGCRLSWGCYFLFRLVNRRVWSYIEFSHIILGRLVILGLCQVPIWFSRSNMLLFRVRISRVANHSSGDAELIRAQDESLQDCQFEARTGHLRRCVLE